MKLVHAADLHLDSPLRGLERYEGAPVEKIRGASRRAMEALVALCLDEGADALLLAGDLYDGDWKDYSTGLFFSAQMSRLREGGVRVLSVRGNHDAASRLSTHLRLPDNVRELSAAGPETVVDEDLGLAVHGQSFPSWDVSDDLARGYPPPRPDLFNVGLLHTALTGREGHARYAPTSTDVLASKGYDYWALGHVHRREVVSRSPWIVFAGNLQGRHARETGAKGATIVDVEGGRVAGVTHRVLDVVRWCSVDVDATEAESPDDVVDGARAGLEDAVAEAEGRVVAARVRVTGPSRAHERLVADPERWESQLRAAAYDVAAEGVWLERCVLATTARVDLDELAGRDDAVGQLVSSLRALRADDEKLLDLLESFADLRRKLPAELTRGEDALRLDDPGLARDLLEEAERTLLPLLLSHVGGEEP